MQREYGFYSQTASAWLRLCRAYIYSYFEKGFLCIIHISIKNARSRPLFPLLHTHLNADASFPHRRLRCFIHIYTKKQPLPADVPSTSYTSSQKTHAPDRCSRCFIHISTKNVRFRPMFPPLHTHLHKKTPAPDDVYAASYTSQRGSILSRPT